MAPDQRAQSAGCMQLTSGRPKVQDWSRARSAPARDDGLRDRGGVGCFASGEPPHVAARCRSPDPLLAFAAYRRIAWRIF